MPAPAGGGVLSLTTDNPSVIHVPANVTIAQGNSTNTFDIPTGPGVPEQLTAAIREAKAVDGPTVIQVQSDPRLYALDGEGWWDVPIAEVSATASTGPARADYLGKRAAQRPLLG